MNCRVFISEKIRLLIKKLVIISKISIKYMIMG